MHTKKFQQLSKKDTAIAGGKGASLGEMTGAGIPVPPGFVILAGAFEKFLEETDLAQEITAQLKKVNYDDVNSVDEASNVIRDLIHDAEMPKDLQKEFMDDFKKLKAEYVAVRSSATAEDSSVASWAGELESYLNTDKNNLLANIKNCWSSLFTPRAIFYRKEKKLLETQVSVAVVVQKMIQSEVSGICFTVHPVTEDRNQMVIEAGWGLGEAIVGGLITPDSFVIDKKASEIMDKNISRQEMMIVREKNETKEVKVATSKQEKQKMADKDILKLAKICQEIENHYGFPCDIEWAYEKKKFYIVQSRPITTLNAKKETIKNKPAEKIFKKSDTRLLSLLAVEYWYRAESEILPKLTHGLVRYDPLIVYNPGKGVDIYYELHDWVLEDDVLAPYFQKNIREFIKLADEHEKECLEIKKMVKSKVLNFPKLFELFTSAWAKLSFIVPLGELYHAGVKNAVTSRAVKTRQKTVNDFYQTSRTLTIRIEAELPQYKEYANFLTFEEVSGSKKISLAGLKERRKGYVFYKNKIYTDISLTDFMRARNFVLFIDNFSSVVSDQSSLKGVVAMKGNVAGHVRVIFHQNQMSLVKKGDILVTPMTTTDDECVMALSRAAAIITDEGGMTSHAAIVAREMKKPCIIGTKIATQVLHDGDEIEVDANIGVVKILKRK